MSQTTAANAIVPSDSLTAVGDAADAAAKTELHKTEAAKIIDIVQRRAANGDGAADVVVLLEGWAHEPWSDYDIARNGVLLAGEVEDYSEKAYKLGGAVEVEDDVVGTKSVDEVHDTALNAVVSQVDETDEDFHDVRGEMFAPKSAVANLLVLDE